MVDVWLVGGWAGESGGSAVTAALAARGLFARHVGHWPDTPGGETPGPAALISDGACDWSRALARSRAAGWRGAALLLVSDDAAGALDAGADDAVIAPAAPNEIAARTAARLRDRAGLIRCGPLLLDSVRRLASIADRPLRLRPREWTVLECLALARRPVDRTELLRAFGLGIDPGTNVVAVQVSRLRAELARAGAGWLIETVAGGYRLRSFDPALG